MANEEIQNNSATAAPAVVNWPTLPSQLCSFNQCIQGHKWPITLALAACPGCSAPVVAAKMENCPICNEPAAIAVLRHDHCNQGAGIPAACRNQRSTSEIVEVRLERQHSAEIEQRSAVTSNV